MWKGSKLLEKICHRGSEEITGHRGARLSLKADGYHQVSERTFVSDLGAEHGVAKLVSDGSEHLERVIEQR